jgi:hypothetical protein
VLIYRCWSVFAVANLLVLAVALFWPIEIGEREYGLKQAALLMAIHGLVSTAMIYASVQKKRGSDIGEKAYPAALMSYVLWLCMAMRWLVY